MKKKWLIYGANGYTGQLIARQARQRGLKPILAGRSNECIAAIAAETGFDSLVFDLDDTAELNKALQGISLVLHCAGPFSATSQPMIEGCLRRGCHYLDITGEISVFANAYKQSDEASHADIVLMPGVATFSSACVAAGRVPAGATVAAVSILEA